MNWERGWEAIDIFKGFLKFSLAYLFWNSTLRALLFYAVFRQWLGWNGDVPFALLTGVRFDLLVLGFFWIPVLLFSWAWAAKILFGYMSTERFFLFWKSYFTLVILISALFITADFFFSAGHQARINHEIWNQDWLGFFKSGYAQMGPVNTFVVMLWIVITTKWMRALLMRAKLPAPKTRTSSPLIFFGLLLASFLVVGLCARGTLTPHHLNREHTEVSGNTFVNELPINPIWALDN